MMRKIFLMMLGVMVFAAWAPKEKHKEGYTLAELDHPVLREWIAHYQETNSEVSLDKFKGSVIYESRSGFISCCK